MSLAMFSSSQINLSLKKCCQQSISKIIFINSDTLMVLRTNNQYQIYQIRSGLKISEGNIPNLGYNFKQVRPINSKLNTIFLYNHTTLCKLHYKQRIWEVQQKVYPFPNYNQKKQHIEYKALDEEGDYLLGIIKNQEGLSSTIFVYDWKYKQFSNAISLGTNFFNIKLTNLQKNTSFTEFKNENKDLKISFALVSDEQKKIFYNHLTFQMNSRKQAQHEEANLKRSMILSQTGKRNVPFAQDHTILFCYLIYPIVYAVSNNIKDGPILLRIHLEEAAYRKILLYQNSNAKKIVRKVFGIIGDKIILLTQNVGEQVQWLYGISISEIIKVEPNTNKLYLDLITQISPEGDIINGLSVRKLQSSLDGNCFFSYRFDKDTVAKICSKENPQFQSNLCLKTIFRIPKKFLYFEMCDRLSLSFSIIEETLKLL